MNSKILLIIILFPFISIGQKLELSNFENLIGKTWKAEGNWGDGSKFIQKIACNYSLDSTLIITKTKEQIDNKSSQVSPRSYGFRQYDKKSNTLNFGNLIYMEV
jgi:hypothetical protein